MRRAAPLLLLAACGASPAKPQPSPFEEDLPTQRAGSSTCDDVSGQGAELGASEDDQAILHRDCVEDAWSPEAIACVMDAPSKQAAFDCAAAEVRGSAMCTRLHALVDAAPGFAGLRGERTAEDFYVSNVQLPGAECLVDDYLQIVVCRMLRTDDVAARDDLYGRLRAKVSSCLGERTWAPALGYQLITWTHADGRQISLHFETQAGTYGLFLYIGAPAETE